MSPSPKIIILPAQNCRRSRKVMAYLDEQDVAYIAIPLESAEGKRLAEQHHLRASPGILVDGTSINPYDILITPACVIDDVRATEIFGQSS